MDINGSVNVHSQPLTVLRNDPMTSDVVEQSTRLQKQTQSVDKVLTEQPIQQSQEISNEVVNARISEHQQLTSGKQMTADEAVGSLIDITV